VRATRLDHVGMTKIYLAENIASQIAESLNILEHQAGDGFEVRSIASVFGRGVLDEDWIPSIWMN
jgi:hypothetical protein